MVPETLINYVNNEKDRYESVRRHVGLLRQVMDRAAEALAKENARWHDDPEGDPEGHAEHHAPANVQFPREVRDEAIKEMVAYHLAEMALREKGAKA